MSFTPIFSIGSIIGLPSVVLLTDSSVGSDILITSRRVFLITDAQTYLVPSGTTTNYTEWAIANASVQIDALDKDYSLQLTVQWLDVDNTVLYEKTEDANLENYNATFEYSLVSQEANGQASLNSPNWLTSRMKLRLSLDDAYNAVYLASSLTSGQNANDRGTYLRENINLFY